MPRTPRPSTALLTIAFAALPAVASLVPAGAGAQTGAVTEHTVPSRIYGHPRRVWVYTPPGYSRGHAPYDLIVAFDGADYQHDVPLPRILDSLVAAGRTPQFVALLIDDFAGAERIADLGNQPQFAAFMADEALPWLRANYDVTRDPHHTIITGSSAGGLGAAYVALRHPELFGKVLSQSGAFWRGAAASNDAPYEWLAGQYRASPRLDLVFLLDVGDQETRGALGGAAPSIRDANRRLRDVLLAKGYRVTYTEVPGGQHRPEDWKVRLPVDIVTMINATGKP